MTPPACIRAPPPLAERLLRRSVRDPEWRESITGDLREEFATVAARRGVGAASRWYWRQAVPLAARFVAGRVVPSARPSRRRRVDVADIERTSILGAGWSREVRHALRALGQRPGLSAVIVGTLAVALAANAVIFNLADALHLRPFRFPDVDGLIVVASTQAAASPTRSRVGGARRLPGLDPHAHLRRRAGGARVVGAETLGSGRPESLTDTWWPRLLRAAARQPVIGRTFTADDGRPSAGRTVCCRTPVAAAVPRRPQRGRQDGRLEGVPHEIVGVMPARFVVPYGGDVWAPIAYEEAAWTEREREYLMRSGGCVTDRPRGDAGRTATWWRARRPRSRDRPESRRRGRCLSRGLGDDAAGPFVAIGRPRRGCCCWWPAPTSPTCCWPAAPSGSRSSRCGWRSAPDASACAELVIEGYAWRRSGSASAPRWQPLRFASTRFLPARSCASCPATSTSASMSRLAAMAALGSSRHHGVLAGAGRAGGPAARAGRWSAGRAPRPRRQAASGCARCWPARRWR